LNNNFKQCSRENAESARLKLATRQLFTAR